MLPNRPIYQLRDRIDLGFVDSQDLADRVVAEIKPSSLENEEGFYSLI